MDVFLLSKMSNQEKYQQRGVSASKEDVHEAIKHVDKGLFPKAFCKIVPDYLSGSDEHCVVMHADGAGTKSSLAYMYWKETGDLSVWKGIAMDAIVMNIDDLLCVGHYALMPYRLNAFGKGIEAFISLDSMVHPNYQGKQVFSKLVEYAYNNDVKSFSSPKSLAYYFQTTYDLFKIGNSEVSIEVLFNKYEELTEKFESLRIDIAKKVDVILKKEASGVALTSREERNKRIYDTNSNAVGAYLQLIDQRIEKEATCDILIPLYSKSFQENKNNPLWIKRAAGRLDGKECSNDPLFVTLVEQLHNLEPSADSAYYLGILNDKKGNFNEALKYYQESVTLETDNYKKAKILYLTETKNEEDSDS